MSTTAEVKTEDKPRGERSARGGRGGRGQDHKEGGRPQTQKSEYQRKGEPKAEGEKNGQDGEKSSYHKDGKTGDGKPRERRHDREPRRSTLITSEGKDGEKRPRTEGEGEHKREKKERPKREFDPDWRKKIVVTLDTEIPPMPKDILPKPEREHLNKNLDECDRKVDQYETEIKQLKEKRDKWRDSQKEKREKERQERLDNKETKKKEIEGNKHLFDDHNALKKEVEKISKEKEVVDAKLTEVQNKMFELEKQFLTKSAMSLDDVNSKIKELEDRQMGSRLTGIEEKKLIQDMAVLKKSIPVAEQYSILLVERNKIKLERKKIMERLTPKLEKKKELGKDIKEIIEKRKAEEEANPNPKKKEEGGEKKEKERPKPDDPFSARIEELIEFKKQMYRKKDNLKKDFDVQWDKYHDQKFEIQKLEYMAREKDHLKRIEEIKERKARELRQKMIDEYLLENTPKEDATAQYKDEIAACELLSNYLTSILPSNRRLLALEKLDDDVNLTAEELNAKLQGDKKLAGLKLTPLVKKEQITYSQGGKKKKNDKKPKKEAVEEKKEEITEDQFEPEAKIVFDIQIRNAFSQLKMEPPTMNKEVEATIQSVEKKKVELEELVEKKAAEIANLRQTAESTIPQLAELKEQFKDAPLPREKGDKGSHGHKDRRGARGGKRGGGDSVQWHGPQDRHPKREGNLEKKEDAEELYEQEDSFETQRRNTEKQRHLPKNTNITESDFPKL